MLFGKKENAWYYKAQKAYRKNKLSSPYAALFDYCQYMDDRRLKGGWGHRDFFALAKLDGLFESRVKDLRSVLPEDLLENFNAAYDKYISLGDDPDYEVVIDALAEYDDYAFDNYERLKEILKDYVTEMIDKHYL